MLVSSFNNLSLPTAGTGERYKKFEGEMEKQESGTSAAENVEASRDVNEERMPGIGCKPNITMHRAQHAIARYQFTTDHAPSQGFKSTRIFSLQKPRLWGEVSISIPHFMLSFRRSALSKLFVETLHHQYT